MGFCFLVILTSYRSYVAFLYDPAENFSCDNTVSKILENLYPVIKTKMIIFVLSFQMARGRLKA